MFASEEEGQRRQRMCRLVSWVTVRAIATSSLVCNAKEAGSSRTALLSNESPLMKSLLSVSLD